MAPVAAVDEFSGRVYLDVRTVAGLMIDAIGQRRDRLHGRELAGFTVEYQPFYARTQLTNDVQKFPVRVEHHMTRTRARFEHR